MAEQELDSLLIRLDSELGDLKGLDSAIDALDKLANFSKDASYGIKQLGSLGKTFKNNFDVPKMDGLEEASRGIKNLVDALGDLSKIGKLTKKNFSDLSAFGQTLKSSFDGIGTSLKGIEEVSWGINNIVKALSALGQAQGVTKSAITNIGNLGDAFQHFNGVNKDIDKMIEPIERLMKAIGNLGNNNRVSIRVDSNGIANVRQLAHHTRRAMSSFQDFYNTLTHDTDRANLELNNMFDLTQPVNVMQRNLRLATRQLQTFESQVRSNSEKVRNYMSNFQMSDLVNDRGFRNAVRAGSIAEAYADAYKDEIPKLEQAIESANIQAVNDAWRHTQEAIIRDSKLDLSRLVNPNLPLDQIKKNLRQLQNELSRAESSMIRALTNLRRLRASEGDEMTLRSQGAYRNSAYTYAVQARAVEQYRRAIQQLEAAERSESAFQQNDAALLRQLPQLEEQLKHYQEAYEALMNQPELTAENQRQLGIYERGIDIITGQIENIRNLLEVIPQSEEGVLEMMRQIADEAERTAKATAEASQELRNAVGSGFSQFGSVLSGSGNGVLGSVGNLSSLFGKSVQNGTAKFDDGMLQSLQGVSSALGRVSTGIGQVTAVANVFISVIKAMHTAIKKVENSLIGFVQGLKQFAKNMLTSVVGAFNAVAGAVSKTVALIRGGATAISVALHKMAEAGNKVISVFARIGSATAGIMKGARAIASLVTPRVLKNLVSASKSLKDIVKQSKLLSNAIKTVNKWFTMLTRMLMRKIVQAFISGLKQAFDDLVLYERNAADEMLKFNENVSKIFSALRRNANQWVAAFEPLINALTPMIVGFLDGMQSMGEAFAKFMAILTGQPYYIRAKKFYEDYGENVDKTKKKVKNLTNSLDELNILNDNKDDDQLDVNDMFKKVPVDGTFGGIKIAVQDILDWIKDKLRNIDWDWLKEKAREWVKKIFDIINTILRDKEFWQLLGKTIGELINFLFTILNEAVHDLDWKALGQAIAELIKNALETIDWALIRDTVVTAAKGIATMWNEIFADKQLWKDIGETVAHVINDVIVAYLDTFAWNFNFAEMADSLVLAIETALWGIDWEQIRHMVEGWCKGIVDVINTVTSGTLGLTLGATLAQFINNVLLEAFKDLGDIDFDNLARFFVSILSAIEGIDWDKFKEGMDKWSAGLADFVNFFIRNKALLEGLAEDFTNLANILMQGLDDFINRLKAYEFGSYLASALTKGLENIDWDTLIALPIDALNKLVDAVQGFADTLNGIEFGNNLAEKIEQFLESIDWEKIQDAIDAISNDLVGFLNSLIDADKLWKDIGETVGNLFNTAIQIPLKLTWNVDWDDLGSRIADAVNKAVSTADISGAIASIGKAFQNIVDFLSNFVIRLDWSGLGTEIGRGIADAIANIDALKLRQMIINAFKGLSNWLSSALKELVMDGSFYRLGNLVGNIILGILIGLEDLLKDNAGLLKKAMAQFAEALSEFIKNHKDVIVELLNSIIHNICDIIKAFINAKGQIFNPLIEVLGDLNLGEILGTILFKAIRTAIRNIKIDMAVVGAIVKDLGNLIKGIFEAVKPYLAEVILGALGSLLGGLLVGKAGEFAGGALGGLIGSIFGPVGTAIGTMIGKVLGGAIGKAIGSALGGVGGFALGDALKGLFTDKDGKSLADKAKDAWNKFTDNLPWKKNKTEKAKIDVEPEFNIDTSNLDLPDTSDLKLPVTADLTNATGSLYYDTLNVDTIIANILKVDEIIGGTLKISDVTGTDKLKNLNSNIKNKPNTNNRLFGRNLMEDRDFASELAQMLNNAFKGLNTNAKELRDMFKNGQFTVDGLVEGLQSKYSILEESGAELYVVIDKAYREKARIHSPSEAMYENGLYTGEGLYNGIKEWIEPLKALMRELVDELLAALQELLDKVDEIGKKLNDSLGGKEMADGISKMTDELDDVVEQLNDITNSIKEIPKLVSQSMKKASQEFKKYIERMTKDFDKFKENIKEFLDNLPEDVEKALEECYKKFEEWGKKVEELLDGLQDKFDAFLKSFKDADLDEEIDWSGLFDGMAEKAEDELETVKYLLEKYLDVYEYEIEIFNKNAVPKMWEGLVDLTRDTFKAVWFVVEEWLQKIRALLEEFNKDLAHLWDGLAEAADKEMAKVYAVVKYWLDKIRELISGASTNMFDGLADAIKRELDEAYNYLCDWCERAKDKIDEAFRYLDEKLNGELRVTATATATANSEALASNTDALANNTDAVNGLANAIRALQDKLGNIRCECNCSCDCSKCAMGQKGGGHDTGDKGNGHEHDTGEYPSDEGHTDEGYVRKEGEYIPEENQSPNEKEMASGTVEKEPTDNQPEKEEPVKVDNGEPSDNGEPGDNGGKPEEENENPDNGGNDSGDNDEGKEDKPEEEEKKDNGERKEWSVRPHLKYSDIMGVTGDPTIDNQRVDTAYWAKLRYGIDEKTYNDAYNRVGQEYEDKVNKLRDEAKSYYDNIMENGTDAQKTKAQRYYDFLQNTRNDFYNNFENAFRVLQNTSAEATAHNNPKDIEAQAKKLYDEVMASKYATDKEKEAATKIYDAIKKAANGEEAIINGHHLTDSELVAQLRSLQDIHEKSVTNGQERLFGGARVSTSEGIFDVDELAKKDPKLLATILATGKDAHGEDVNWFSKGNGTTNSALASDRITDADTIQEIKDYISQTYGINEDSENTLTGNSAKALEIYKEIKAKGDEANTQKAYAYLQKVIGWQNEKDNNGKDQEYLDKLIALNKKKKEEPTKWETEVQRLMDSASTEGKLIDIYSLTDPKGYGTETYKEKFDNLYDSIAMQKDEKKLDLARDILDNKAFDGKKHTREEYDAWVQALEVINSAKTDAYLAYTDKNRSKYISEANPLVAEIRKKGTPEQIEDANTLIDALYNGQGLSDQQYHSLVAQLEQIVEKIKKANSGEVDAFTQIKDKVDNRDKNDVVMFSSSDKGDTGTSGNYKLDPVLKNSSSFKRAAEKVNDIIKNNLSLSQFKIGSTVASNAKEAFEYWYQNSFLVRGYQMGGIPNSGELFISRENGTPEFVGSFGNKTVVANNDQIVTAVANGVAMANDSLRSAIETQTQAIENAINNKELDVTIGDREIAEANRRGQQGMGAAFVT